MTLHYSRRVYNGLYVRNPALPPASETYNPEDSVNKQIPAPATAYASKVAATAASAEDQCTALAARLFGTWTLITSFVRIYAAYHLAIEPVYRMAMATYVVALTHFLSEWLVFKSMTLGVPQMFPFTLATIGIIWMSTSYGFYVET